MVQRLTTRIFIIFQPTWLSWINYSSIININPHVFFFWLDPGLSRWKPGENPTLFGVASTFSRRRCRSRDSALRITSRSRFWWQGMSAADLADLSRRVIVQFVETWWKRVNLGYLSGYLYDIFLFILAIKRLLGSGRQLPFWSICRVVPNRSKPFQARPVLGQTLVGPEGTSARPICPTTCRGERWEVVPRGQDRQVISELINVTGWCFGIFFVFPYIGLLIIPID